MPVEFIEFEEARRAPGLRMIVVPGIPSPGARRRRGSSTSRSCRGRPCDSTPERRDGRLGEGAQRTRRLLRRRAAPRRVGSHPAARRAPRAAPRAAGPPIRASARGSSASPTRSAASRASSWERRLQGVHAGLEGQPGGFPAPVAQYLSGKYGYRAAEPARHPGRVIALLGMLAGLLHEQRPPGQPLLRRPGAHRRRCLLRDRDGDVQAAPAELCPMMDSSARRSKRWTRRRRRPSTRSSSSTATSSTTSSSIFRSRL
jgi:hypothetical protein